MPTYHTFGDDEPQPSADTAKLRTEWHTQQITTPVHKLVEHAAIISETNEASMKPIYRKLTNEALRQQGVNTKDMADIISRIGDSLRSQVVSNQAAISAIVAVTGQPPGGGLAEDIQCPPNTEPVIVNNRVVGCKPILTPPIRPRVPPHPPGPPVVPPEPPPQPGPDCGTPDTPPCLPPNTITCAPGEIPVIVGGLVIACLKPCPAGYHYQYTPGNPYPSCVKDPPLPPPCDPHDPTCGLGCGPVCICDGVPLVGCGGGIGGGNASMEVKLASSSHIPSELWGPAEPLTQGNAQTVWLYVGARPPTGVPARRISGPAPLADIIHGFLTKAPSDLKVKTAIYADAVPPPLGTVCPGGGGGPCPEANCPDGFHWEQQGDGTWKCVPDPANVVCKDLLKGQFPRFHMDDKKLGATLVTYTQVFGKLGSDVRTAIEGTFEVGDLIIGLEKLILPIPLVGKIISWLTGNSNGLATYWDDLRCTMKGLSLVSQIYGQDLLLGLYFTKAMIRAFESIRVGWDIAVWITGDFTFQMKELDDLVQYLINRITQQELPTAHEALRLFYAEKWPEDWAKSIVNMNGQTWQIAHDIYHADRERITPQEAILFGFRQGWDDDTIATRLYSYGLTSRDDVDDMIEMNKEVPPPSDVIHFVVREAFNPNKLGREEMIAELTQEPGFRDLARSVGITKINIADDSGAMKEYDVPLLHWLAHYQEISPTQGYDMVHRLRPDRVRHFRTFVPNQTPEQLRIWIPIADFEQSLDPPGTWVTPKPFTSDILARLLKQLEYNPLWRAGLEAISYHVLTRVDVRRMYGTGTFGEPHGTDGFERTEEGGWKATKDTEIELVNRYMDQGYTREDSGLLGYFTAKLYDDTSKKIDKRWFKDICTAYSLGTASYEDSLTEFKRVLNGDEEAAQKALDLCDFEETIRIVQTAVKAIRTGFMRGEYDDNHARGELYNVGIVKKRNDQYLTLWRLELAAQSKQASASMMCQWYGDGSISLDDMYTRLTNVGFKDADARRIVNHCQLGVLARTAAERDKAIKAALAEQRRLQSAEDRKKAKDAADAAKRLAQFLSAFTDKHIKDWWKDGLISRDEVAAALRLKGWGEEQVQAYLLEYTK